MAGIGTAGIQTRTIYQDRFTDTQTLNAIFFYLGLFFKIVSTFEESALESRLIVLLYYLTGTVERNVKRILGRSTVLSPKQRDTPRAHR